MVFGFPKNEWPEEVINYTLAKDAGFLLKNFSEKGWGLFDLQSLNVIMPAETLTAAVNKSGEVKKDDFSDMLATIVNDSTIKQRDIEVKPEANVPKELAPEKEKSAGIAETTDTGREVSTKSDVSAQILYSAITKSLQRKSDDGVEMVYTDEYNNGKDTIRIFIPAQLVSAVNSQADSTKNVQEPPTVSEQPVEEQKNENKKAGVISPDSKAESGKNGQAEPLVKQRHVNERKHRNKKAEVTDTGVQADAGNNTVDQLTVNQEPIKGQKDNTATVMADSSKSITKEEKVEFLPARSGMINSNCRQYATEDDFLKLRKKMAAENSDDDMIITAKKTFKAKCFTTKDIRNLSTLFLSDQGKYNFFDAAYPYVSDSDLFYSLQGQLSDPYYVKRFEAMVHH